MPVKLKC